MKAFVVLALVATVSAQGGYSSGGNAAFGGFSGGSGGFGVSSGSGFGGGFGSGAGGFSGGAGAGGSSGGQIHRHVYLHVAPDDPTDSQARVVRLPGGGNKHVNIIFVKTPSSSSQQQTEVILPEQDEQKNLVYVLVKKGLSASDFKIRRPASRGPSKPEVFFIRYKDGAGAAAGGSSGGAAVGGAGFGTSSSGGIGFGTLGGGSLSSAYGAP